MVRNQVMRDRGLGNRISNLTKGGRRADKVYDAGVSLGEKIAPELFNGGLDRVTPGAVTPGQIDFNSLNNFFQPSVDQSERLNREGGVAFNRALSGRMDALGGLDAAENQALKEQYYRGIDRERAGAMTDIARAGAAGQGSAATYAQKRALSRDFRNNALQADRQLLLDNIGLKRQALSDFEGTAALRQNTLGAGLDRTAGIRGQQAATKLGVDSTNISNNMVANSQNVANQMAADQFNANQQLSEIGGRIGASAAGIGLVQDERDKIQGNKQIKTLLDFLRERDNANFSQIQSIVG